MWLGFAHITRKPECKVPFGPRGCSLASRCPSIKIGSSCGASSPGPAGAASAPPPISGSTGATASSAELPSSDSEAP
eukprot:6463464-Pyramimonas_sp.AAC.1